jgi:NAD(P) transhydrogenase subunit alpha
VDGADLVLSVQPLRTDQIRRLSPGAATVSFLPTGQALDAVRELRDCAVTSFALELVPRISRAQSMDALSLPGAGGRLPCAVVAAGCCAGSSRST